MIDKEWEAQLEHLRGELILMKESIRETAVDIIKEGFSKYPIFIAHQDEIKVGELILDKEDMATVWSISASTMEEFNEKALIPEEKKKFFITQYKNPKEFICLFVIYKNSAHFVFVPYKAEQKQA
ncbi:MAG TPA: hypothetical protein DIW47_03145 [Bacteroidetes bacterium]|nr:hypothetical protein [Bacteroidota bacterium]